MSLISVHGFVDNFAYKTLAVVASPVKRIVGTDACWAYSVHVKHGLHQAARLGIHFSKRERERRAPSQNSVLKTSYKKRKATHAFLKYDSRQHYENKFLHKKISVRNETSGAENRTLVRWVQSENVIHCAMRPKSAS